MISFPIYKYQEPLTQQSQTTDYLKFISLNT